MITLGIEWGRDLVSYQSRRKYGDLRVVEYINSSYASNLKDKKLIIGYHYFFGRVIIT